MKQFLSKILIFSIPSILLILLVIWIDFFKIFGFHDYYLTQKVGINREMVTTSTFNHFREKEKYDSFIFGSSRSQAYKCKNWMSYLDNNSKPFHFDASGEGIWGITKKVEYIDKLGDTIKNALIIIDRTGLEITYPRQGHLFVSMPCVSKYSKAEYYLEFLKASLNLKFLLAYIDYSIFEAYREYMGYLITHSKFNHIVNNRNCDIWYGWDKEIKTDSVGYYSKLIDKGIFYERPKSEISKCEVTTKEIFLLNKIKNIFTKHNTNYKIIISPVYDQVPMEEEQVELLEQIFGQENIYNFSGKNKFSDPINNFYETSHYKPFVANEIMNIIYIDK
jgi:hypothetical protein